MKLAPLSNVLPVEKNTCGVNIDPPSIFFWLIIFGSLFLVYYFWFIIFSLKGIFPCGTSSFYGSMFRVVLFHRATAGI